MTDVEGPARLSVKDLAGVTTYHLTDECPNAPIETREWPIPKAERRGLDLCKRCDPTHDIDYESRSRSLRDMLGDDDTDLEVEI
jgi:hypothetical protein